MYWLVVCLAVAAPRVTVLSGVCKVIFEVGVPMMVAAVFTRESSGSMVSIWAVCLVIALLLLHPRVTVLSGVCKDSFAVDVPMMVAAVVTQESSGSVVNILAVCLAVVAPKSHRAQWCSQGQFRSCCTHDGRSCVHPRVIRLSGEYSGGVTCFCCTHESLCSVVFARTVSFRSCCTQDGRSFGHPGVIRLSGEYLGGGPCCCCTQESPCSVVFAGSVSQLLYP